MKHYQPQPDCSAAWTSNEPASAHNPRPTMRTIGTRPACLIVLTILAVHWIGMQCFIVWLGGEEIVARGQAVGTVQSVTANARDDGWRRTAKGWEYLPADQSKPKMKSFLPTVHIAPSQVWPAAAAACMILLIAGLPDSRADLRSEVQA